MRPPYQFPSCSFSIRFIYFSTTAVIILTHFKHKKTYTYPLHKLTSTLLICSITAPKTKVSRWPVSSDIRVGVRNLTNGRNVIKLLIFQGLSDGNSSKELIVRVGNDSCQIPDIYMALYDIIQDMRFPNCDIIGKWRPCIYDLKTD